MNEDETMKRQFELLLPFHLNGTLKHEERAWVERYLAEHPEARAELRWTESLRTQIRDSAPDVSAEAGFDKLLARMHAHRAPARPRLSDRLRDFFAGFQMTPAFAMAAAVIAVQAGIIVILLVDRGDDYAEFRSMPGAALDTGPVLQVNFRAEATERDIRLALVSVGGAVIGGPGQLGNYLIKVQDSNIEEAARLLGANRAVESVQILPRLPVRE